MLLHGKRRCQPFVIHWYTNLSTDLCVSYLAVEVVGMQKKKKALTPLLQNTGNRKRCRMQAMWRASRLATSQLIFELISSQRSHWADKIRTALVGFWAQATIVSPSTKQRTSAVSITWFKDAASHKRRDFGSHSNQNVTDEETALENITRKSLFKLERKQITALADRSVSRERQGSRSSQTSEGHNAISRLSQK